MLMHILVVTCIQHALYDSVFRHRLFEEMNPAPLILDQANLATQYHFLEYNALTGRKALHKA